MTISYREAVSIAQLIVFVPCAAIALLLTIRHGFGRASGWIYLVTFSLLRIIGAIFAIIAASNPSTSVITGEIICLSVGVAPLCLLLLGLLSRVNDFRTPSFPPRVFKLLSTVGVVGAIIGVVGGTKMTSSGLNNVTINGYVKAAVIIFLILFLIVLGILGFFAATRSCIETGEKRLLIAVALSTPFYFVRLLYALIGDFGNNPDFSSLTGSTTIFLAMAVIEEFVIVVVCLAIGLTLRVIPKSQREAIEATKRKPKVGNQTGYQQQQQSPQEQILLEEGGTHGRPYENRPRRERRGGPIQQLVRAGIDAYQSRESRR